MCKSPVYVSSSFLYHTTSLTKKFEEKNKQTTKNKVCTFYHWKRTASLFCFVLFSPNLDIISGQVF